MTFLQTFNANLKNVKKIMKNSTTTGQDELNKSVPRCCPMVNTKEPIPQTVCRL